jgi:RNA polymerase sigma-70 factor (ECF subfamily)
MANHENQPRKSSLFMQTDWGELESLKQADVSNSMSFLDALARKYWTPICQYLRVQGYDEFEAQDLTQDFFAFALTTSLFAKADQGRGRFRNFLLKSLNNFAANKHRLASAQRRSPAEGVVSLEGLAELGYFQPSSLRNKETPESIFHHAWLREVVRNVVQSLEQEFADSGRKTHFILFISRVVSPELNGDEPPPLQEQAGELGLEYKEAANQIVTAKRAFVRLLEKEVRVYAGSEDEASREKWEVLHMLGLAAHA